MSRDLRAYQRQTTSRLIIGVIVIIFVVGDGLILLFYGKEAALMGLLCMGVGLLPVVLVGSFIWIMDFFVRRVKNG